MRTTRKTNSDYKRFCIFITEKQRKDGSSMIEIEEVGDEILKKELKEKLLREILEDYKK